MRFSGSCEKEQNGSIRLQGLISRAPWVWLSSLRSGCRWTQTPGGNSCFLPQSPRSFCPLGESFLCPFLRHVPMLAEQFWHTWFRILIWECLKLSPKKRSTYQNLWKRLFVEQTYWVKVRKKQVRLAWVLLSKYVCFHVWQNIQNHDT